MANNEYLESKIQEHDSKFNHVDDRLIDLEKKNVEATTLIKGFFTTIESVSETNEKISNVLVDVKVAMQNMQNIADNHSKDIVGLNKKIQDTDKKVDLVNETLSKDNEKNKIDIRDVQKSEFQESLKNIIKYGGGTVLIVGVLGTLIKILDLLQKIPK